MGVKNILIIGGDSFIAKKFISAYRQNYNIYPISRKKTENQDEVVVNNFFEIPESLFENIDVVMNFAAIVHQPKIKDRRTYEQINYELPMFLAQMAIKNKCRHFIQMSTIAVYGNVDRINKTTGYSPVNFYGEYKLKADLELDKLTKNGVSFTFVRPSMVYGGYNSPGNMNTLIKLIKTKVPLPFKGIYNKRQFLNVNNLTQAFKGIIDKEFSGIIILADEEPISIFNLVDTISKVLNYKTKCFKSKLFWKVVRNLKPDIAGKLIDNLIIENTYSFEKLGVNVRYSIEDGIKEMIFKK